jgi:hypothetical protein
MMLSTCDSNWQIRPFLGIGPISFGQPRSEVLALLGPPSKTFKSVPFATTETDWFAELGVKVFYDPSYCVETVDVIGPSTACLGPIVFLGRNVAEVRNQLGELGYQDDSLTFHEAGIALFEEDGLVTSVTVFPRGCFDLSNPDSPLSRANAAAARWYQQRRADQD